jgi:hypothetical protein
VLSRYKTRWLCLIFSCPSFVTIDILYFQKKNLWKFSSDSRLPPTTPFKPEQEKQLLSVNLKLNILKKVKVPEW